MAEFCFTAYAQDIHFRPGAVARLPAALYALSWRRLPMTTGPASLADRAGWVGALLGERWAATFDQAQLHVPTAQVVAVVELARDRRPHHVRRLENECHEGQD
ncbi:MAG: hypothetical protein IT318_19115 [Anaerolineales bacterium]|nr:hypothetical protein [Anaerolineales bacterium]